MTAASPEAPVTVRKLEWRGLDDLRSNADALFGGVYRITVYPGMAEPFKLESSGFTGPSGLYGSWEAARHAAQEHFDRAVLGVIVAAAGPERSADAAREVTC